MKVAGSVEVLLVEDDPDLRDILVASLSFLGLSIRGVHDSNQLDREFFNKPADILLLDLNLPGEDGHAIAARYRRLHPGIGIVMLTARGDRHSRVMGYAGGADHYFVKPADHEELALALQNLNRRLSSRQAQWVVDLRQLKILAPEGRSCDLTYNEIRILGALAEGAGTVVKRSALYGAAHLDDEFAAQRLETALSRLRLKMKRQGLPPLPVKACHGVGYAFVEPVSIVQS
jgi:two-component system OmpR family response regulator